MKKLTSKIIAITMIFIITLMLINPHSALSLVNKPFTVTKVVLSGLNSLDETEFLHILNIHEGDTADENKIREGIKALFKKGLFDDLKIYGNPSTGVLTVAVEERPIINDVEIAVSGNLSKKVIKEAFILKEGMQYNEDTLRAAVKKLTDNIIEKGFPGAFVEAIPPAYDKTHGKVKILLNVKTGEPLKIKKIIINDGQSQFTDLLNINEGDIYDKQAVESKLNELKKKLAKQGYYNPDVKLFSFNPADGTLVIEIKTGKKLLVTFKGNEFFSTKKLNKEMPFLEYGGVGPDIAEEAKQSIVTLYHQKGYIDVSVSYELLQKSEEVEIAYTISEGKKHKVDNIIFTGITQDVKKLKSVLYTKEGEAFNPDVTEDDKTALLDYYRGIGFFSVKVTEIFPITDTDKGAVTLQIHIEEGQRLIIGQIKVTGEESLKEADLLALIKIPEKTPYSEQDVFDARQALLSYLKQHGYANGDVKVSYETDSSAQTTLIFHITEGNKYYFGNTLVRGNVKVKWELFQRIIKHVSGEPFDVSKVNREMSDLYRTGLFTSVDVEYADHEDGLRDVVFHVVEGKAGVVEYGLGYGEYDGLRGFVNVKYINLDGMNRQLSLNTKVSMIERKVSLNYYEPWFMKAVLPFSATISYEGRNEKNFDTMEINYRVQKYTAAIGVEKELSESLKGKLFYEFNWVKTWDVQPDVILSHEDSGTLAISSIVPSVVFDNRDNPLEPTAGFTGGINLKLASKVLLSETDFIKLSGYVNYYLGLTKGLVLATSLRSGIGQGWSDTVNLPIIERYFLGGGTTVRGFGQDNMGPKGANGDPTGGNAFLMSNLEFRIRITDSLGLVLFSDTGNVWPQLNQYSLDDINYTAGGGLRYNTPVGPLRLDYGYKLNRKENESPGRFYFSIGQAF
ncbi:MAG: outer membrane protein assembly factor BamA [Nitrospirae bacterium]|nr:outer membrane protein assembly factor BamA [Nitrospirota bacterium]MBF0534343.1 outer membrane protein assembly factor BamA [Nitrospirota bacterium]MBF0615676.1 outer membrane protein assembly factor BamA [Nitrospirota bacterium]